MSNDTKPLPRAGDFYIHYGTPMDVIMVVNNGDGMACKSLGASHATYVSVDEVEPAEMRFMGRIVWMRKE